MAASQLLAGLSVQALAGQSVQALAGLSVQALAGQSVQALAAAPARALAIQPAVQPAQALGAPGVETLAVLPMLVVLATATLALLTRRFRRVQVGVSLLGVVAYAGAVAAMCWVVVLAPDAPGAVTYQVGDWSAPVGITLVADALSAFVLATFAAIAVPAVAFSVRYLEAEDQQTFYYPLVFFLLLGVSGAVLTGDLFNLFVWFEVTLMASYVLVAFYGGAHHTGASMRYLVLNLVGSAGMLVAIGGIYGVTGTLNMADVARRLADAGAYEGVATGPVLGLAGLLLAVFALKAGLVPFQFWVPSAYTAAPMPATALLAGAAKKVGVYAIVRVAFTVLSEVDVTVALPGVEAAEPLALLAVLLGAMAAASVLVGGLGALHGTSLEEVFAYSSIGQVGFIVVPVAIAAAVPGLREVGIAAALVFVLHHTLTKGTLFLATGAVRTATGTSRLHALGGLAGTFPALAVVFFVGLLSLVGIPPLSGFVGKFLLFEAAAGVGPVAGDGALGGLGAAAALAVAIAGSLLTIAYGTRTWMEGFWDQPSAAVAAGELDRVELAILLVATLAIVGVGVGFEFVYGFAELAAEAAVDTDAYVDLVDPEDPTGGEMA